MSGTGKTLALTPPKYLYNGISFSIAVALATAKETANIALAPRFDLFSVPSASIISLSILTWSSDSSPIKRSAIFVLMFSTAFKTPFPRNLFLSPSLSSNASLAPVDAPLGTIADATTPLSRTAVASTVGFPLESKTSLPIMSIIVDI